ncbi:MAG: hypothetical protein QOD65_3772, partial [Gaiellales bacterium]|nr:hypothetical protein [Gaiellales bacterium]
MSKMTRTAKRGLTCLGVAVAALGMGGA